MKSFQFQYHIHPHFSLMYAILGNSGVEKKGKCL